MSLIERLEAAEVGDQDLSLDVNLVLEGGEEEAFVVNYTMETRWCIKRPSSDHVGGFVKDPNWPVTTSLDAALALAERVCPEALWSCVPGGSGKFCAGFHVPRGWGNNEQWGTAPTPALALCIAILKAKETK